MYICEIITIFAKFLKNHENLSINIIRDITMMKLAQQLSLMNRSDSHRHTSGFVRRAIFVLSLLVFCLGSVWGQEYYRYELTDIGYAGGSDGKEHRTISQSEYKKYGEDVTVEVTFVANQNLNAGQSVGGLSDGGFSKTEGSIAPSVSVRSGEQFSVQYSISFLDGILENSNDKRIVFNVYNKLQNNNAIGQASFEKAYVLVPKPDDPFLNTANENCKQASGSDEKQQYTDVFGVLSFTKIKEAFSDLEGVKYARIYVKKDGNIVEYNTQVGGKNLLTVTGGKKAGESEKNGLYVYNNGQNLSLNNINIVLNGGIGNLAKYEIVVLLSKDKATVDGKGNVTREPQWNYEYTYSFTYPFTTKIRYKTLLINGNGSPYTVRPILLANWFELAGDCGVDRNGLAQNLCVRWYLEDKQGKELPNYEIKAPNPYTANTTNKKGFYKNGGWTSGQFKADGGDNEYRVNFTINIPSGMTYSDVRLVCEATTLGGEFGNDTSPDKIQVKYIYDLKKHVDSNNTDLKFAHYEGEAYRYLLMEVDDVSQDTKKEDFDYIDGSSKGIAAPTWDSQTNDYKTGTRNVRQNVHTVHYYYYVNKSDNAVKLILPLQYYDYNYAQGGGAEPRAYFRWYDYETDQKSPLLAPSSNNYLNRHQNEWGLFAYNLDTGNHPTHARVGVTFNATQADFTTNKEYQIACDVSRYLDGMDESFKELVHEPTLSIRYLFHIMPANDIADEIEEKISENNDGDTHRGLSAIENKIMNRKLGESISILENEGRTVVSTNDGFGEFALRTKLSSLDYYYFYAGENKTNLQQARSLWWYAYYYDGQNWWRHLVPRKTYRDRDGNPIKSQYSGFTYRTQTYQAKYSLAPMNWNKGDINEYKTGDFEGGWQEYDTETNSWKTAVNGDNAPEIKVGSCVQMVACVTADSNNTPNPDTDNSNTITVMPIIWTELEFIDAMPLELQQQSDETAEVTVKERTDVYMGKEYVLANRLEFNEFSLLGMRKPTHSYENFATLPMSYPSAQYGFIYPQLYGYCATMRLLNWGFENGYFGSAAMHGDYALLKSMNMPGISMDKDIVGFNGQSIQVDWVNGGTLYDVTHERKQGKNITDNDDYGGFIYVDAADEARTIASLEFDANLCANAKIYYTAYVASMTGKTIALDINGTGEPGYVDASNPSATPQAAPMLRFRVSVLDKKVDDSGETISEQYVPVITFVTGNIRQEVSHTGTFSEAQWYQVYGYTTIPSELAHMITSQEAKHYRVEIDNYCDNTDGADYCIDQISFYTNNAQLRVKQTPRIKCDDEGIAVNVFMEKEQMEKLDIVNKNVYWRIYIDESKNNKDDENVDDSDSNGNSFDTENFAEDSNGKYLVGKDFYGTEMNTYGIVTIPEYDDDLLKEEKELDLTGGYFKITENDKTLTCFSLISKNFVMPEGPDYYISIYTGIDPNNPREGEYWGNPCDTCSVYSHVFVPKALFLSVSDIDGNVNPTIEVACSDHVAHLADYKMILNVPDDTKETGYMQKKIPFDYFVGDRKDLKECFVTLENKVYYLEDALEHYRAKGKTEEEKTTIKQQWAYDEPGLDKKYENVCKNDNNEEGIKGYYEVLKKAIEEGKLHLACSHEFSLSIGVNSRTVLAFATIDKVRNSKNLDTEEFEVCSPMALTFNVKDNLEDPSMMLGFKDVKYAENIRVVRVGKAQLANMQKNGYLLHIPVNKYKANIKDENWNSGKLEITSGQLELVKYDESLVAKEDAEKGVEKWTNDTAVEDNIYVATFAQTEINEANPYISLKFDVEEKEADDTVEDGLAVKKWDFKEGYTYRMFFQVKNGDKVKDPTACDANVEFLLKVVPEYVTWNDGTLTESGEVTENGNVNNNWNNDKNWSRSKKAELYKTVTNSDDYEDNGTAVKTLASFVPMKFTYVTIPSGNVAPRLIELTKTSANVGIIDSISINGNGVTVNDKPQLATDSIEYDLMVMIDSKTECEHGTSSGTKVYDVEKFYGNVCKEIYFKPSAELINQQFLIYEKAWVEKELVANKWYLMSTPLKATYAGDMYVPYEIDKEGTIVKGRQETEAFQPITIAKADGTLETGYSRTKYSIYQRSWGKDFASTVYKQKTDVYRSDYSANLGYTTWSGDIAEWGHTFNDVQVPYTTRTGFAVRAHKEDQEGADGKDVKALIRLPKEDLTYYYYLWDGKLPQNPVTHSVTKGDDYAQLIDVEKNNTATEYYVEVSLSELQSQVMDNDKYTYYLVGNPFMASLDMQNFFDKNADLEEAYYTYEESSSESHGTSGKIRPLQAFFVKMESSKITNAKIKFTADMMTDGNNTESDNGSRLFALTAANNRGQSTANVSVGEEARSVETLFDSNLNDVPMVYTVADGQAVSINQVTDLNKPIAFGVTCATNDEPVAVTFSDIAQLTSGEVYVVDAANGSKQQVTEGVSYSVQPNDYGRYFLTFAGGTTGISEAAGIGVVVSVRGRMVTVTSGEMLTEVRAISPDGATVYRDTSGGTTASFTLTPGVYVVKAENAVGEQQTVKVIVK